MSGISSISLGGYQGISAYSRIASSGAVNKAAEDASEFSIEKETESQVSKNETESGSGRQTSTKSVSDLKDEALSYNSRAAMELNGFQVNKEKESEEVAAQEARNKQAMDSYQNIVQKQQQEDVQQKSIALLA